MTDENTPIESQEFGSRFVGGLSWTASAQLASQVVTFLVGVLLARLLAPSDFGIVAMALVFTTFVLMLSQTGFNAAIVYMDDVSDDDLCTMYWANLAINVLLFALAVVLSPLVGRFFHNERLAPVISVISLGLIIAALAATQRTLLQKHMDFSGLARIQLMATVVYAVSATAMALAGMGVWAIVVGRLLEQVADSVLSALAVKWHPRLAATRESLRRLLGYGSHVWAGNMLFYGQENLDNLVVGRVLGATPLGYYSLAFRLANVPRWFFTGVLGRVMFPAFASGKSRPAELRNTYLRVISYAVLVAVGLGLGLALVAGEFVYVVYGAKWLPAVAALRVLAVAAGIYCTGEVAVPILWAVGKPGLRVRLMVISTLVLLCGALVGVRWGIAGVALAVFAAVSVIFVLGQLAAMRALEVSVRAYAGATWRSWCAVAVMVVSVLAWKWVCASVLYLGPLATLVSAVAIGVAVTAGALLALHAPEAADVLRLSRRVLGSAARKATVATRATGDGPHGPVDASPAPAAADDAHVDRPQESMGDVGPAVAKSGMPALVLKTGMKG